MSDARAARWLTVAGAAAAATYVALVDPERAGAYPLCPSRLLLGLDCPFCGGLRGTHDLLHGRVGEALDHNLLLPVILLLIAGVLAGWRRPAVGGPSGTMAMPRVATVAAAAVAAGFTLLRNLPMAPFELLASGAAG